MVELHPSEIIGQRLRQQREARRVTLEQAAAALHFHLRYVEAMDKGEFDIFPSPAQARGFLRSYAQYLNLDAGPFLTALDGDASLLEEDELEQQDGLDQQDELDQEGDRYPAGDLYPQGDLYPLDRSGLSDRSGEDHAADRESLADESLPSNEIEQNPEEEAAPDDRSASSSRASDEAHPTGDDWPTAEGTGEQASSEHDVRSERDDVRSERGTVRRKPEPRSPRTKFEEIGQTLRLQRENLGLSLSDIERQTRLRAFYLKALEAGDLEGLPSPVQGRGMLKNYASFLGLDADTLLLQFAEGLQARLAARPGLRILKRSGRAAQYAPMGSPRQHLITTDLLLAGVLVVFLIAFIAWGAIRISAMRTGQAATATAPAIADVLAQVGTPTVAGLAENSNALTETLLPSSASTEGLPAVAGAQTPSPTPPPNFSSASVQVIISVRLRTWMRVTVDGKVAFDGRVQSGSAFPFAGDQRVEILTGNGAGLEVNFNQTDMGALGTFGETVQRVFTVQGMQSPTPTITHTPAPATVTPIPTLTPAE